MGEGVPAIVAAGDGRAAKAVYGESKAFLEVEGRALVARVVAVLQRVPEISEVWVVGNAERLEAELSADWLREELRKPLTIMPQFRNLYENTWESYRRLLPGAGPAGRDPEPGEEGPSVLYLSCDLPFATPQEISSFVQRGLATDCDYALGLVTESAMEPFYPSTPDDRGIEMAYFNLREGRYRQSNLHLVKPALLGNRMAIEEMYEHRYQKQIGNALSLAWRVLSHEGGGFRVLLYYMVMHLAGAADRRGLRALADWLRRILPISRVERAIGSLLKTRFRFVTTEIGGCAVDVDNELDLDTARLRFREWSESQRRVAEQLHGPLPLPERAGAAGSVAVRVLPRHAAPETS